MSKNKIVIYPDKRKPVKIYVGNNFLTDDVIMEITKHIGSCWEFIAPQLNIGHDATERFKMDYPGNCRMQMYSMFIQWRDNNVNKTTIKMLVDILEECRRNVTINIDNVRKLLYVVEFVE